MAWCRGSAAGLSTRVFPFFGLVEDPCGLAHCKAASENRVSLEDSFRGSYERFCSPPTATSPLPLAATSPCRPLLPPSPMVATFPPIATLPSVAEGRVVAIRYRLELWRFPWNRGD